MICEDGYRVYRNGEKKICWKCKCDCGNEITVCGQELRNGDTQSCGCVKAERDQVFSKTHGESKTRLYHIWKRMRQRCNNANSSDYAHYGGRGIRVCDEWQNDYHAFRDWALSHGYIDQLTLDRIDVDGNYCPDNCRFVSMKAQSNNRTNSQVFEYNGEAHTIAEWAELTGIQYGTLYARLCINGWSTDKALTEL